MGLPRYFNSAGYRTSSTSVDFPEPDTPVTQTRRFRGMRTSMFLRLCSRAPVSSSHLLERASATTSCVALVVRRSALRPVPWLPRRPVRRCGYGLATAQVFAGQRLGLAPYLARSAEKYDFAAALAGAGAHVENAVRLQHDLRIVLDDDQRVARVAQPLHHADDPLHVARMQADGRLIQHEQGVDQRGSQRGGQVDPLHFAARQRARLAIERQITQADIDEIAEAAADFAEQQVGRFIQRLRQCQVVEELAGALHRQQHHVMDRQVRAVSAASHPTTALRAAGSGCIDPSAVSASSRFPTRHSSASVFSRAPSHVVHGVYAR